MSGDGGWSLDTLKVYFEDLRKADQELRKSDQQAVKVLAANFETRMSNTNEWRNTVEDQQNSFAEKEGTERRLKLLEDAQIVAVSKTIGASQLYMAAVAVVVAVGAILALIMRFVPGATPAG